MGKAKAMIKSRKVKQRQRAASALRKQRRLFHLFIIATKDGKPAQETGCRIIW
jgi:hypothetical protein